MCDLIDFAPEQSGTHNEIQGLGDTEKRVMGMKILARYLQLSSD